MPLLDKTHKTVVYMAEEHKFSWNSLMSDSAGFVYKVLLHASNDVSLTLQVVLLKTYELFSTWGLKRKLGRCIICQNVRKNV